MTADDLTMTHSHEIGVRIGGEPRVPETPRPMEVVDPSTGRCFATVVGGGAVEAQHAVDMAVATFDSWSAIRFADRAAVLRRLAAATEAASLTDLPALVTRETGKRLAESRAEIEFSAAYFRWYASLLESEHGVCWNLRSGFEHRVAARALGVVAIMTPWNFPVSIPVRKVAPAIAAGCTVVFKPSEVAPLSGLRLAELLEAELPSGVVSTVVGPAEEISRTWLADPRVRGVSFTGSTRVGRIIAKDAIDDFKRLTLELGGKAPFVVLDDADIDAAVNCLMTAKYRNNGQSCIAADSVWLPAGLVDQFAAKFLDASSQLVIGDPLLDSTTLGPLALPNDPSRLAALNAEASRRGAEVLYADSQVPPGEGFFVQPSLCVGPPDDASIAQEEIFGPAVTIRPYRDVDEVINSVSRGFLGLAGYVCGRDLERAIRVASALEVGIAGVNTGTPNTPHVPFGGLKHSGLGYEGGHLGLDAFLQYRTTAVYDG